MPTATQSDETLGDLLHSLGHISPHRILLRTPPGTATEDDALAHLEGEFRRRVELIDGTLVEKWIGFRESVLAGWIATLLNNFIVPLRLGVMGGSACPIRLLGGHLWNSPRKTATS